MQPVIFSELEHRFSAPSGGIAHSSSLWYSEEFKKVFLVWYQGSHERSLDTKIFLSTWDLITPWTRPVVVNDSHGKSDANAIVWSTPFGKVHCLYCTLHGKEWTDSNLYMRTSEDGGKTFGLARAIPDSAGWLVRCKPFLDKNRLIVPIYYERSWSNAFFIGDHDLQNYKRTDKVYSLKDLIQPSLVHLKSGRFMTYFRSSHNDHNIHYTYSDDDARTFMPTRVLHLPNNNSAVDAQVLKDGRVILAFNDSSTVRTPLSVGISDANGVFFEKIRNMESVHGEYSYPALIQLPDGRIIMSYTHQKDTIQIKVFLPEWITRRPDRICEK